MESFLALLTTMNDKLNDHIKQHEERKRNREELIKKVDRILFLLEGNRRNV